MSVRKEKEMINAQTIAKRERTEEDIIVWLKAKSPEELRHFMAGPWTASLLSAEEMEEMYQELQREEESLPDGIEVLFVEVGLD